LEICIFVDKLGKRFYSQAIECKICVERRSEPYINQRRVMQQSFFGIKQKFIALALALLLAVSVFVAWFFPMRQESEMSSYLNQKAFVLAQVTAYGTASGMMFDDTVAVNNALEGLKTLPDVQFVLAYNPQGVQMGAINRSNAAPFREAIAYLRSADFRNTTHVTYETAEITIVAVQIAYQGATHGQLVLGLSREFLEYDVRKSRWVGIAVSLTILLCGGLIFFWQTSRLVRPIQTLEAAASKVARGDLDIADVPIVSHDEVGTLTQVFNQMVGNLRVYIAQIHQQTYELGLLNNQLKDNNLDLAAANEEIQRQIEVQTEQAREIELANTELQEKNMALDEAMKELQAAQSQLVQSERMNAAGMLTAGVMHEINNPNAAILSALYETEQTIQKIQHYFFALLDESSKHTKRAQNFAALCSDADQTLAVAHKAAQRVKNIVANLQNFTKHQREGMYVVNLPEEIASTVEIFRYQFKEIAVQIDVESDIRMIGNAGELNQVFLNLMVNAAQAGASAVAVRGRKNAENQSITLEIADNGRGMDEKVKKHIFEAFFSTKGTGNSGLGLSISKQIIERHGASLHVESRIGTGTTFTLTFPQTA
jgi:signal transduction histidine kinase/HAMP domain-containing protein